MVNILEIITITKDDHSGLLSTINSTRLLRAKFGIKQLVIDSSSDENRNLNEQLLKKEENISYFWQEPHGISEAFNYGVKNASAKWLWFLNGGDIINPVLDLKSFIYIIDNSLSDAIVFQVQYKNSGLIIDIPELWSLWPPVLSWIPHPSTIIRRELFDMAGMFNRKYKIAMDYEFWIRCFSRKTRVGLIHIPIAIFDETGVSHEFNNLTKAEVRKIMFKYTPVFIKKWFWQLRIILKAFIISLPIYKKQ